MTNEEAIEILKDFEELNPCVPSDKEAVNVAIIALEQEPCETQMIDKSNFSQEQYLADIQSAYDCGKSAIYKIRAEIQGLRNCSCSCSDGIIDDVEDIIDKYMEESEGIMISENMSLEQMNKQFEDFSINKFAEDVDKRIESYLHPKQYVRFGRFPKDNISKNRRGDEIVKEEKGLSVWNCVMVNDVPFPILPDNPSEDCLADYFYMLLSDRNVYLVTGEELEEKGSAGEPLLVGNIEIIREYTADYDYLKKIHTRRNRKE